MVAATAMLRRSVRAGGQVAQVYTVVGKMNVRLQSDLLTEEVSNSNRGSTVEQVRSGYLIIILLRRSVDDALGIRS